MNSPTNSKYIEPGQQSPLPLSLLIIGMRGTGKTRLANHFTKNETRLIIVDTLAEEMYERAGLIVYTPDALLAEMDAPRFRLVYRPTDDEEISSDEGPLKWALKGALAVQNCTVLIEEVSQYATAHKISRELERAIRFGRHRQVRLVATSQRPADIHKLFLSQADIILGKIFETNDARYLRGLSGVSKETILRASELPPPKVVGSGSARRLQVSYIATLDNSTQTVITSL